MAAVLVACAGAFVFVTRHWPMVSDAAQLHYAVFLIRHGWAPYRDFVDINMPGAYWITAAAMRLPDQPDLAWRCFDLALVAAAGAGFYVIARPYSRFAALLATALLLLVHGQDGVHQAGQRDLAIASLLVLAVAFLIIALRRDRWLYLLPFGLAAGLAATIKPTAAPLGLLLLLLAALRHASLRRQPANRGKRLTVFFAWIAVGTVGLALPLLAMVAWLARYGALHAWIALERLLVPFYATLERRPLSFTLAHSISPLLPLVLVWLLAIILRTPPWPRFERILIAIAAGTNLLGLLAQGKALPYQRYPFLALLLLLISLDLTTLAPGLRLESRGGEKTAAVVALAGIAFGCLGLVPLALVRVHRFDPRPQPFNAALATDLRGISGNLNGRVQCLDTIEGCLPTLYSLRLLPATGTLSDLPLFGPAQSAAVQWSRQRFTEELAARPPLVIVVVSGFFLDNTGDYRKLDRWPAFSDWLAAHYTLTADRTFAQPVRWWTRPTPQAGYRLYVLNSALSPPGASLR